MNDSNRTLRFSRSAKEAYGHDIQFEDSNKADIYVFVMCLCCLFFILGFLTGGM